MFNDKCSRGEIERIRVFNTFVIQFFIVGVVFFVYFSHYTSTLPERYRNNCDIGPCCEAAVHLSSCLSFIKDLFSVLCQPRESDCPLGYRICCWGFQNEKPKPTRSMWNCFSGSD